MTIPEHPILFSGEMVRAIQRGEKTQTRRVIVPQPHRSGPQFSWLWEAGPKLRRAGYGANYVHTDLAAMVRAMIAVCPYGQIGHRLWVREAWRTNTAGEGTQCVLYSSDFERIPDDGKWRPSIHMPRWASRLTLEITMVRAERLQQITDADARAEGCCGVSSTHFGTPNFRYLWDSLNAKRGYGWDVNPWVYVLEFKKV